MTPVKFITGEFVACPIMPAVTFVDGRSKLDQAYSSSDRDVFCSAADAQSDNEGSDAAESVADEYSGNYNRDWYHQLEAFRADIIGVDAGLLGSLDVRRHLADMDVAAHDPADEDAFHAAADKLMRAAFLG